MRGPGPRNPRRGRSALLASRATAWAIALLATPLAADDLPAGYWSVAESQRILDKTLVLRLQPDLSALTPQQRQALGHLLRAGRIGQEMYEDALHPQARAAFAALVERDVALGSPRSTQNLLLLYRLFAGPIATTPENERLPFLPVDSIAPGKNVYPWAATRPELDAFLDRQPEERTILLDLRSVVRRVETEALQRDLAVLARHPVLDGLHPRLRARLESPGVDRGFYAVPYSVAWAEETLAMVEELQQAAALLDASDADFARFLRLRARDLLSDDYEGGDAAWVRGSFGTLNAQIGAYEVYDDELYAAKTFPSVSLLLRDEERSAAVRHAVQGMQEFENSLPTERHDSVREDIPVGVYHVIADFGQARGTNTASILPNEPHLVRKYGRTILMRANILTDPALFASARQVWEAALAPAHWQDLEADGNFHRTLWHELGHYLGPDLTHDGRGLGTALQEHTSTLEEMKADLVALHLVPLLQQRGYYGDTAARQVYASGILRVLRPVRPRREQSYATMQLMQMNYFLERGLLRYDPAGAVLHIDYARYHDTVASLLEQVLRLQDQGDKDGTTAFIERYTEWRPEPHEKLAEKMRAAQERSYRLVWYAALEE